MNLYSSPGCGIRLAAYTGNRTAGEDVEFDFESFRADRDAFPWLAAVIVSDPEGGKDLLCSGAFISHSVVVVSAHCVVGAPQQSITVKLLAASTRNRNFSRRISV